MSFHSCQYLTKVIQEKNGNQLPQMLRLRMGFLSRWFESLLPLELGMMRQSLQDVGVVQGYFRGRLVKLVLLFLFGEGAARVPPTVLFMLLLMLLLMRVLMRMLRW